MNQKTTEKTILLVEDEQGLREAMKMKFEQEGIKIIAAATGEEALVILNNQRPDLVMLDILLPGMNGLEVLRYIRENPILRNLGVVIVSVSGGVEKIKQAFALNVLDYLVKSEYKIEDIVKKIKKIL